MGAAACRGGIHGRRPGVDDGGVSRAQHRECGLPSGDTSNRIACENEAEVKGMPLFANSAEHSDRHAALSLLLQPTAIALRNSGCCFVAPATELLPQAGRHS